MGHVPPSPIPSRRLGALAAALVLGLGSPLLAGCGSYSDPAPPTGVDELEVPTPSPDPADFVDVVDNPWFVLDEATFTDRDPDPDDDALRRSVAPGPLVEGVPTTAVTFDGVTDLYAQDARGNVWWFSRVGEWEAGAGGAEAGLAMPAEPRTGDGFRRAEVPGQDLRAEVVAVDGPTVLLRAGDADEGGLERYSRGTGLTTVLTTAGDLLLERE
jgi:hypothetical protein